MTLTAARTRVYKLNIMSKVSYYTAEGLKKLRDDLNHLKDVERPKASQAIAEARDKGDLSENAEYDAAKEAHEADPQGASVACHSAGMAQPGTPNDESADMKDRPTIPLKEQHTAHRHPSPSPCPLIYAGGNE